MHVNGQSHRNTLICDLDGTLVDSAPDLAGALITLLAEAGRDGLSLAQVKSMIGDGVAKLVERGFTATGGCPDSSAFEALVTRFIEIYNTRLVVETRPYPGALETLTGLKEQGWRLIVCTNKPETPSREILQALELAPLFEAVAGGDSYPFRKPDPRHILTLLEGIKASPQNAVMFGDGPADIGAARGAGIPSLLAGFGYGVTAAEKEGPDHRIEDFSALPKVLMALNASAPG
ncbi:HAD-IA family hydrolase [Denitrobaculum tricleocarpae]|uniref:phosphoglycolate phosphatase n=1 Tax=Denitrobaculum tricleocarpae TaxID=2591009 RepID=A0A545TU69_9PROT|nr:HAD-IA family hydrolase [Denitrobaculum tricleocarpae]TQV80762.1 HAD-IA family hydrolase [Denitrobaculum tricleocarpae]